MPNLTRYSLYGKKNEGVLRHLVVEEKIHAMLKVYAKVNKMSLSEATYIIIGKGLASAYNMPEEDIDQIK